MFNPTRDEVRQFFIDVWAKYRAGQSLTGAEAPALEVVLAHPEYHGLLSEPERHKGRDYRPEEGETNPFLHLSLHLAVSEQLSVDQPPGIRSRYTALLDRHGGDTMQAQHDILECLGEIIWQVQRNQTAFDSASYLACLDRQLGRH